MTNITTNKNTDTNINTKPNTNTNSTKYDGLINISISENGIIQEYSYNTIDDYFHQHNDV